ncbi:MAG: hypothetical protein HZA24_05960 [Nitrospirae bacterium]|nr:hypothetical protein [Nitrospirota bacterium]
MREWFSPSELAGLPGMPGSARHVRRLGGGTAAPWKRRPRNGARGFEYHIGSLPRETRAHLTRREVARRVAGGDPHAVAGRLAARRMAIPHEVAGTVARNARQAGLAGAAPLAGRAAARMDARLAVLTAADRFVRLSGMGTTAGMASFCHLFNTGEIALPPDINATIPSVTPATLYRWRKALNARGAAALAGRHGNRRGDTTIHRQPALHTFVTALLADHPHARASHLLAAVRARFGEDGAVTLPAPRSIQRWLAR